MEKLKILKTADNSKIAINISNIRSVDTIALNTGCRIHYYGPERTESAILDEEIETIVNMINNYRGRDREESQINEPSAVGMGN